MAAAPPGESRCATNCRPMACACAARGQPGAGGRLRAAQALQATTVGQVGNVQHGDHRKQSLQPGGGRGRPCCMACCKAGSATSNRAGKPGAASAEALRKPWRWAASPPGSRGGRRSRWASASPQCASKPLRMAAGRSAKAGGGPEPCANAPRCGAPRRAQQAQAEHRAAVGVDAACGAQHAGLGVLPSCPLARSAPAPRSPRRLRPGPQCAESSRAAPAGCARRFARPCPGGCRHLAASPAHAYPLRQGGHSRQA